MLARVDQTFGAQHPVPIDEDCVRQTRHPVAHAQLARQQIRKWRKGGLLIERQMFGHFPIAGQNDRQVVRFTLCHRSQHGQHLFANRATGRHEEQQRVQTCCSADGKLFTRPGLRLKCAEPPHRAWAPRRRSTRPSERPAHTTRRSGGPVPRPPPATPARRSRAQYWRPAGCSSSSLVARLRVLFVCLPAGRNS